MRRPTSASGSASGPFASEHSAITLDDAALGLGRVEVDTTLGPIVVRAGREAGGPATILLHGAAGSWSTWSPMLRADDARGATINDVIAFDLPGWGETALPSGGVPSVSALSDAVAETARAIGYSSWRVIGHSLGGFVALDLAVREPAATIRVDLVSATGAAVVEVIRQPLSGGARLPWFGGMLLGMRVLARLGRGGTALLDALNRSGALPPLLSPLFGRNHDLPSSVVDALVADARPDAFLLAASLAAAYDLHAWRRIDCPVRSIAGDRDVFVGKDDAAILRALVPDVATSRLAGVGHFAAVERPDAVLDLFASA